MTAGPPAPRRVPRAAHALLLLYPRAWRDRYRGEVRELLAQHRVSTRTLLDLLFGAIDAHLHPGLFPRGELTVTHRIRTSQLVVSCAVVLYASALISLQQIRDPQAAWLQAAARHPQIRSGLIAVQVAGAVAVIAGIAGFLLVTTAMIRQAATGKSGDPRRLVIRGAILALAWLGITATAVAVTSSRPGTGARPMRTVDLVLEAAWLASTAIALLLGAMLLWRALARAELTEAMALAARITATAAAAAMTAGLIATLIETSLLRTYGPDLIGAGWLTVIASAMFTATAMTGLALFQMRRDRPAPPAPLT
jgi:hypothetical protein